MKHIGSEATDLVQTGEVRIKVLIAQIARCHDVRPMNEATGCLRQDMQRG